MANKILTPITLWNDFDETQPLESAVLGTQIVNGITCSRVRFYGRIVGTERVSILAYCAIPEKKGDTILRLLMAMGIMFLAAVIVIGLRGAEAFLRLLPIYLILCVLIAAFILLGRLEKKASKRKN